MTKHMAEPLVHFCQCRDGVVDLPPGLRFQNTRFQRRNSDLIIEETGGGRVFVRNFYCHDILPTLRTNDCEEMSGGLAAAFVTLSERTVSALMACGE